MSRRLAREQGPDRARQDHADLPHVAFTGAEPDQNLWQSMTSHHGFNRVHAGYPSMLDSARQSPGQTFSEVERVKTICNAPYLRHANQMGCALIQ